MSTAACSPIGTPESSAAAQRISEAIAAASSHVALPPGVYLVTTPIRLRSGVALVGRGVTLRPAAGIGAAVLLGTSGDKVTDVTIEGIRFDGQSTQTRAIQITSGARIDIVRCAISAFGNGGILLDATPDSTIHDCRLNGAGARDVQTAHSILLQNGSSRSSVTDCRIVNGTGMGIAVAAPSAPTTDVRIASNHISTVTSSTNLECIGVSPTCDRAVVVGNVCVDSKDNGISVSSSRSTVTGNVVDGTVNHGIHVESDAVVTGNFIRNPGTAFDVDGLDYGGVRCTSRCVITGNLVIDAHDRLGYGVKQSGSGNVITDNSLSGHRLAEVSGR